MKVDAASSYRYPPQQLRAASDAGGNTSFAATLSATQADNARQANNTRQADFTSMTRQEMRDWMNTRIRSGEMSLDESRPLMAMTMKIPAAGTSGVGLEAESDGKRYDFMQIVRDGMTGALSRNDDVTLDMLKSAMSTMLNHQGQAIGVNSRA